MTAHKGYYSVVQYCRDRSRLEAANTGVLLFCPELDICRRARLAIMPAFGGFSAPGGTTGAASIRSSRSSTSGWKRSG